MKILSWNVRGLGSPPVVRHFQHMLKLHHPHVVFFMETKLNATRMEKFRRRCGFQNGPSLRWNGISLEDEEGPKWQIMGIYGAPKSRDRARA
ncbi:BEACH domain-containing lvsC [Gossypium australe]|uniref:BEACH domain-containing lvsC n=1 Tax=Gossypium australe TaxID=47621 RepID=A0A5B6WUN5_9ROSI|nr:BEACH domain-containing lvsC [Gossypium australe]